MKVSPGYLETTTGSATNGVYSDNKDLAITALLSNNSGSFFVVRHDDYSSISSTNYTIKLPTSQGTITVPQIGGRQLSLNGRDSKIHLTDYSVGDYSLLYSTGEVFTWKKFADKTVLILYGGPGEVHEFALKNSNSQSKISPKVQKLEGAEGITTNEKEGAAIVVQWTAAPERQVIQVESLVIYLLGEFSSWNLYSFSVVNQYL